MQLGCRIQPQGHRKNRIKSRLKVRKQFVSIEIYATRVYAGRASEVKRWYKPRQYNRLLFFRLNSKRFCFQLAKITMHFLSSSSHWFFISFRYWTFWQKQENSTLILAIVQNFDNIFNQLGLSCAKLSISWSWPSFGLAL